MNSYIIEYAEVKKIVVRANSEEAAKERFYGENVKDLVKERGVIEVTGVKKLEIA